MAHHSSIFDVKLPLIFLNCLSGFATEPSRISDSILEFGGI